MKFRCRAVKPKISDWKDIEADSPENAAQEFHDIFDKNLEQACIFLKVGEDGRCKVSFLNVEVEGYGNYISRMYHHGIWRRGGVRPEGRMTLQEQLAALAKKIGWDGRPSDLIAEGWEGEETMEDAERRKYGKSGKSDGEL